MSISLNGDGIISGVTTLTTPLTGITTFSSVNVAAGSTSSPSITPTGDSNTGIFFPSADTIAFGEGGTEVARFDSSGRTLLGGVTANANGGVLQLSSGITFPATDVAATDANTLDDYEEGTFTPTLTGSSGTPTYGGQFGRYTKVGNLVTCYMYLYLTNKSSLSGALSVSNLPFTSVNVSEIRQVACYTYYFGLTTSIVAIGGFGTANTASCTIRRNTAAATSLVTSLDTSEIGNSFEIMGTITFFVA